MDEAMQQQIDMARALAIQAHEGQFRSFSGEPYIRHPQRVAEQLTENTDIQAAWLHDVLEDTDTTAQDLLVAGVSDFVVCIVIALTRLPRETYAQFIDRILLTPGLVGEAAVRVKIADVRDNLRDLPKESRLWPRYTWALGGLIRKERELVKRGIATNDGTRQATN